MNISLSRRLAGIVLGLCLALPASAGEPVPLKLGFFPIISTIALFKRFSPLQAWLAEQLEREVVLETARDFPNFVRRTAERQYDIVVTAPHFALLAADSGRYRVVASLKKDLVGFIVVRRDSPVRAVGELAGRLVATPPEPAIITQAGMDHLRATLDPPPFFTAYRSHNAAYQAVLGGDADAAVVSVNAVKKAMKKGLPLRRIGTTPPLPNMAVLVATDLPATLADEVRQALLALDTRPRGREVLRAIGLPGYRPATDADYEITRPYLARIGFLSR